MQELLKENDAQKKKTSHRTTIAWKQWKMDAEGRKKNPERNVACSVREEVFIASYCGWFWIVDVDNPKRQKSWFDQGQPLPSNVISNGFGYTLFGEIRCDLLTARNNLSTWYIFCVLYWIEFEITHMLHSISGLRRVAMQSQCVCVPRHPVWPFASITFQFCTWQTTFGQFSSPFVQKKWCVY